MNSVRIAACAAALLLTQTLLAEWGSPCNTTVLVEESFVRVSSIARCSWVTGGVQNNSVTIHVHHTLAPGDQLAIAEAPGYCGTSLEVQPYEASTTYTSTAKISAQQAGITFEERTETFSARTKDPMRPRDDAPEICYTHPWKCDPRYFECPLIVQTGNDPWHFTTVSDGVAFDLNSDGVRERTAWTTAGSSLAFLAIDLDGNGRIDDGRELFGEHSGTAASAANGFVALARYDSNGDAIIDAGDAVWPRLLLWRDTNHDGSSQADELQPLSATVLRALHTSHHPLQRRDPNGNMLRYQSLLRSSDGETRAYYDVYLRTRD